MPQFSIDRSDVGVAKATEVQPVHTLQGIATHAEKIRDNVYDINSTLRGVLIHLRGEELTGDGIEGKQASIVGKLTEISVAQQWTRSGQDETFRLLAELQSLLNVNA